MMTWRRLSVLGVLIVGLCVAFTLWQGRRSQQAVFYSSSPVVPPPGAEAVFALRVRKPDAKPGHAALKDYRKVMLRLRCVSAHGQRCKFNVYRTAEGMAEQLSYSVDVNYATNDLAARSTVVDSHGRTIPAAQKSIDGDPVVFRYLLSFPEGYLKPYEQRPQGSDIIVKRLGENGVRGWGIQMFRSGHRGAELQWWTSGDWIWNRVDAWTWYAIRRSVTPSQSPSTQK